MSALDVMDWTQGTAAIAFQRCAACAHVQYFRRGFCAACGAPDPAEAVSTGRGIVYAATTVHRAATPEAKAHVPYVIVLIDLAEGFRMMAHGAHDLRIGDRVAARFAPFAGRIVPYFERT